MSKNNTKTHKIIRKNTTLYTRIDPETKKQADVLFQEIGISTGTAIRIFIKQCIHERGFPFIPHLPNNVDITTQDEK